MILELGLRLRFTLDRQACFDYFYQHPQSHFTKLLTKLFFEALSVLIYFRSMSALSRACCTQVHNQGGKRPWDFAFIDDVWVWSVKKICTQKAKRNFQEWKYSKLPFQGIFCFDSVITVSPATITVRGGRSGVAAAPRSWKISGQTLFSGQALIAKILNDKKYFNTGEKFQGNSVFQG